MDSISVAFMSLAKAVETLRTHGLPGLLSALRGRLHRWSPAQRRWRKDHQRSDRAFDRTYGVETGGFVATSIVGQHTYIPISEREFEAALTALPDGTEGFTFIDLGCGKGKALLLASLHRWRRIVGVEYQEGLCRTAEANLWNWRPDRQQTRAMEIVCGDAGAYAFPLEPLVVYLYNPFGSEIMSHVARNLASSYREHPRPIWVIYVNPCAREVWEREGFESKDCGWGVVMRPGG